MYICTTFIFAQVKYLLLVFDYICRSAWSEVIAKSLKEQYEFVMKTVNKVNIGKYLRFSTAIDGMDNKWFENIILN